MRKVGHQKKGAGCLKKEWGAGKEVWGAGEKVWGGEKKGWETLLEGDLAYSTLNARTKIIVNTNHTIYVKHCGLGLLQKHSFHFIVK